MESKFFKKENEKNKSAKFEIKNAGIVLQFWSYIII